MDAEKAPTELIVVCCHGIWTGGPARGASEDEWLVADFQRGETGIFVEHAREGIRRLADTRGRSVLVFSGGPTRKETPLSEAQSYLDLAVANNFWNLLDPVPSHPQNPPSADRARQTPSPEILIDPRALDSYHNILYPLTLFHSRHSRFPEHLTIISHAFKRRRIVDLHCAAIGFPLDRVTYLSPTHLGADEPASMDGVKKAEEEWERDPHGRGEGLAGKRRGRNPWGMWQGVFPNDAEWEGSGLVVLGDGEEQRLDPDAPRPFTRGM